MKLVIIESPYAGDVARNVAYARAAVRDSLLRGEAPIASHLLYTQEGILRDEDREERTLGIEAGLAWGKKADLTAVYVDFGVSSGMAIGMDRAKEEGRPVELRQVRDFRWEPNDHLHNYLYLDVKGFVRCGILLLDASPCEWNELKPWKPMLHLPFRRLFDHELATAREKIIEWCWIWGSNTPDEPLDPNSSFRKQRLHEVTKGMSFRKSCKLYLPSEGEKK